MDNRIFMHDLESGLSLMLRNDIASHKYLTGTKLSSIKEILRILVKVTILLFQHVKFYFV